MFKSTGFGGKGQGDFEIVQNKGPYFAEWLPLDSLHKIISQKLSY